MMVRLHTKTIIVLVLTMACSAALPADGRAATREEVDQLRSALREAPEKALDSIQSSDMAVRKELIPELLKMYHEEGWSAGVKAGRILQEIGRETPGVILPRLLKDLRDAGEAGGTAIQLRIIALLGNIGPEAAKAVPALVDCLEAPQRSVRYEATMALGHIGPAAAKAVPTLANMGHSRDPLLRRSAAGALQSIGQGKDLVDVWRKALDSPGLSVRLAAADALKSYGQDAREAVPELLGIVRDEDVLYGLRIKAAAALGAIGPPARRALPVLLKLAEGADGQTLETVASAVKNIKTDNKPPSVKNVRAECPEGRTTQIELVAEDSDDVAIVLKAEIANEPDHGELTRTGRLSFRYHSTPGFAGKDTFTWTVTDGTDASRPASASVSIKPDTTPPTVERIAAFGKNTKVQVVFNEPLDASAARATTNYTLTSGASVKKAELTADGRTVLLTTTPLSPSKSYKLSVRNVRDRAEAGNAIENPLRRRFTFRAWSKEGLILLAHSDGNAKDASGRGNHGKETDGAGYSRDGVAGQAFSFAGQAGDDKNGVNFGNIKEMNAPGTFSVAFWFKRTADREGTSNHDTSNIMFGQGSNNSNDNIEIGSRGSALILYLDTVQSVNTIVHEASIRNGQWYHVAVTYDQGRKDEAHIYLNGVRVGTWDVWGGTLDDAGSSPIIVGNTGNQEAPFEGLLDEVFVFTRVLKPEEIRALAGRQ